MPRFAVLMGDLVRSERTPSPARLHARFNAAVERQNAQQQALLASPLTITLGDEFQGLVTSLVAAAEMARDIRFDLLEDDIDCRFAIGVASLTTELNSERAWNMMGPGLAETRARLNDKRSETLYRFVIPGQRVLETFLDACGATLTMIEREWTDKQRADIQALLAGASPAEIARRRNVSLHTVYKVRGSGNFELYRIQWNAIRGALAELDGQFAMGAAG